MKKILMIATGGTIASRRTEDGMTPQLTTEELLKTVPEVLSFCGVDAIQLFNLDSTHIQTDHWLAMARTIEDHYPHYDGFIVCHGTDTMAYTASALSYLIQQSPKPIVITGSQKPIDMDNTDARINLADSFRLACHDRAHDVTLVFDGQVIAGTRAKKERSKSYNAFSSINFPVIAMIRDERILFYIDDKPDNFVEPVFYRQMDPRVFLLKLIPGLDPSVLTHLERDYDALIIESFGVGGLPDYKGRTGFSTAVNKWAEHGKIVVMATQVPQEGSDMRIYAVGRTLKHQLRMIETYDMTLESAVTKLMWILSLTREPDQVRALFYRTINHDILLAD